MNSSNAQQPNFAVITGETVHKIIVQDFPGIIQVIEAAYLAHHRGHTVNPDSYFLRFPDNPRARIIALPAHFGSDFEGWETGFSGIKWIASYPANLELGIPRASAVLVLNDGQTGYPFACIESSIISATRTAASAVSGAWHLNQKQNHTNSISIIGTGLIARFVMQFLIGTGWSINKTTLYDRNPNYAAAFKHRLEKDYQLNVTLADSDNAAIRQGDIIIFTTTAGEPYLHNFEAFAHNPLVLNISLRDIGADIILNSFNVVDDIDHCLKANTSPHLAEQKTGHRDFIYAALPEILSGKPAPSREKPIIFSPFGMGILDLALGALIYRQAQQSGELIEIPNFFYEMQRI